MHLTNCHFILGTWTRKCLVSTTGEALSFEQVLRCLSFSLLVKLNGGRNIVGILRGFDPFMNLVIDETVEETKDGAKNNIGMVVRLYDLSFQLFFCITSVYISRLSEEIPS